MKKIPVIIGEERTRLVVVRNAPSEKAAVEYAEWCYLNGTKDNFENCLNDGAVIESFSRPYSTGYYLPEEFPTEKQINDYNMPVLDYKEADDGFLHYFAHLETTKLEELIGEVKKNGLYDRISARIRAKIPSYTENAARELICIVEEDPEQSSMFTNLTGLDLCAVIRSVLE